MILIGTYRVGQFKAWKGYYNYPISDADPLAPEAYAKIDELWLFNGTKAQKTLVAEFVGVKTRQGLVADYGYPAKGRGHGERYLLFKTRRRLQPSKTADGYFIRTRDFAGRSPRVAAQLKAFLKSPDRTDPALAAKLPRIVTELPKDKLVVGEEALQMDFSEVWFGPAGEALQPTVSETCATMPRGRARVELGDGLLLCDHWDAPTVIVSDGPYGLGSYPGDPPTPEGLAECYRPFLRKWYERALPSATLWFWNSEQGWANCHRMIEDCGWEFRNCHIWDKGLSHVAGNCNTKTIRKYPVVTEVCAQYVRKNRLPSDGREYPLREWMRTEWKRTGLPFRLTNVACGVKDAATRKYFTTDHLWYFPPADACVKIARYANDNGSPTGRPYFAKPDGNPFSEDEWELMRSKFHCEIGVSNVWHLSAVRGKERLKKGSSCLHMNQKPLALLEQIIRSSSDVGDVVWEPFGGLCSASVAAIRTGRIAFDAEMNPEYCNSAIERVKDEERRQCK